MTDEVIIIDQPTIVTVINDAIETVSIIDQAIFSHSNNMQSCFIGQELPAVAGPYLWVETGLGTSGNDFTFWIEDGV